MCVFLRVLMLRLLPECVLRRPRLPGQAAHNSCLQALVESLCRDPRATKYKAGL
jgi:hypothetical protein